LFQHARAGAALAPHRPVRLAAELRLELAHGVRELGGARLRRERHRDLALARLLVGCALEATNRVALRPEHVVEGLKCHAHDVLDVAPLVVALHSILRGSVALLVAQGAQAQGAQAQGLC
jgi:hypothetical protein